MNNKSPLVSVLMGVYYKKDDIAVLRRSVDSILAQTFSDFEFLICDDGSTKQAMTYLQSVAGYDSRIKLVRQGNCRYYNDV